MTNRVRIAVLAFSLLRPTVAAADPISSWPTARVLAERHSVAGAALIGVGLSHLAAGIPIAALRSDAALAIGLPMVAVGAAFTITGAWLIDKARKERLPYPKLSQLWLTPAVGGQGATAVVEFSF